MPKRTDIESILIIGAGPIVIGQACEFDYSGTQATRALKEEGYRVILVNSNPATIMTDPDLADATYIEPITVEYVTAIIENEKPDAILPTVGGQTALNLAMDLFKEGVLDKYNVQLIGAQVEAIEKAEDRERFKKAMDRASAATEYTSRITRLVSDLTGGGLEVDHPLLEPRESTQAAGLLVLTANRGLCGGFNGNLIRAGLERWKELSGSVAHCNLEVSGKRGISGFKFRGVEPVHTYTNFEDSPIFDEVNEVASRPGFFRASPDRYWLAKSGGSRENRDTPITATDVALPGSDVCRHRSSSLCSGPDAPTA